MNEAIEKILPTLLSVAAAVGVGATAILAARGHKRATDILAEHELPEDAPKKEVIKEVAKLTWKEYAPAVGVGAVTVGMIFASNGMHLEKEAALVGLVGVLGSRVKYMDREVIKRYGKEALDAIRHDILDDEVKDHADKLEKVVRKKHKDTDGVYYDPFTNQFFWSNEEDILKSLNVVNEAINNNESISLADFLLEIKKKVPQVKVPDFAYDIGWYPGDEMFEWNMGFEKDRRISVKFNQTTVNGWDAIAIQFNIYPEEPGEDYVKILSGEKVPYSMYSPEPGDQLDMRNIDLSLPIETGQF